MMPACATFDYFAVLPEEVRKSSGSWSVEMQVREPIQFTGDRLHDFRLVGLSPTLEVSGGRLNLRAPHEQYAGVAAASFEVDPVFTSILVPQDLLHVARTGSAELGVSVIRQGSLVVAVGAVTAVPLGESVKIHSGWLGDPGEATDTWVDFSVSGETRRLRKGEGLQIAGYDIWVEHCFIAGMPGQGPCLSVALARACPADAATRSAKLLDRGSASLGVVDW